MNSEFYTLTDCVTKGDFKLFYRGTLLECAEECLRRKRCVGINYQRFATMCSLKEANPPNVTTTYSFRCVYAARKRILNWASDELGVCNSKSPPCDVTERCESASDSSSHSCPLTECDAMPVIEFASVTSGLCGIGATNAYLCDTGYTNLEDGSITTTCKSSATWSAVTMTCYKNCEEMPTINFRSTTRLSFGTVVHKPCMGNTYSPDQYEYTCNIMGQWIETGGNVTCYKNCALGDSSMASTNAKTAGFQPSYPYMTTITLECKAGYASSDGTNKVNRTCLYMGLWEAYSTSCT